MDINKYYEKCKDQLLKENLELALDTSFPQRLKEQLLSELQVVLVKLKPEDIPLMLENESEDSTPLSIIAKKCRRGRPPKTPASSTFASSKIVRKREDYGKLVLEVEPSTNKSPLLVKMCLPPDYSGPNIRFEIDIPQLMLDNVASSSSSSISKKNSKNGRINTTNITNVELSNVVAETLEENNVQTTGNVPPEPELAPKKRRTAKKKNTSSKKKLAEEEEHEKGDLARYIEDFSGDCNATQSCSSTPKVSSTTQNNETSNVYEYLNFNLIDYINNNENQAYNVQAETINGSLSQGAEVSPDVIYLPQVSLQSNMQYSIQPLNAEQPPIVVYQSWNDNTNNNVNNVTVVESTIENSPNVDTNKDVENSANNANKDKEEKSENSNANNSIKALDMPSLDDMEPLELSNDNEDGDGNDKMHSTSVENDKHPKECSVEMRSVNNGDNTSLKDSSIEMNSVSTDKTLPHEESSAEMHSVSLETDHRTVNDVEMCPISTEKNQLRKDVEDNIEMQPMNAEKEKDQHPEEYNIEMHSINTEKGKHPELFEDIDILESQLHERSPDNNRINSDTIDLEDGTADIANITMDMPLPMKVKIEELLEYLGDTGNENDFVTQHNAQSQIDNNLTKRNNSVMIEENDDETTENPKQSQVDGILPENSVDNNVIKEEDMDTIDIDISVLDMEQLWQNEIDFNDSESIQSDHGSSAQKAEESSTSTNPNNTNLEEVPVFYAGKIFEELVPHNLRNSLQLMASFELNAVYNYHCNHKHLFIKHFPLFCEIFGLQKKRNKLFNMVRDCERYSDCGYLLQAIYSALMQCGFNSVNACRHILKRSTNRTPQTMDILVDIIMQAGWTLFHEELISFGQKLDYKYRCDTIEKMVPMVVSTQNPALQSTFLGCLFHMKVEESLKISDEVKHLLHILSQKKTV